MDQGDEIFNALLTLGWNVSVDANGQISAEQNAHRIYGQIQDDGHILWEGMPGTLWAVKQARILALRERAETARTHQDQRARQL